MPLGCPALTKSAKQIRQIQIFEIKVRETHRHRRGVMSIARSSHGEIATRRICQCLIIEILPCGGVKNFDRLEIQRVENTFGNSGPPVIVGVGGNRHAASVFDRSKDLRHRLSTHVGKQGPDAKQMAFRCRNLDPRNNEKSLRRQAISPLKFVFYEIFMRITSIVIRYRDTA